MNKEYPIEEELEEAYKTINQLTNNWNELEEWLKADYKKLYRDAGYRNNIVREILDKMKEIKDKNDSLQ